MIENTRELSLKIIMDVLEQGSNSDTVFYSVIEKKKDLDKKEKAFIMKLSYGVIERKIELDYIINQFSKLTVNKMKPVIRNILRQGVYQLKYMDQVPNSAACNESVKLVVKRKMVNLKGFVNGVLRSIERNMNQIQYPKREEDFPSYLGITYSMPDFIVDMWLKQFGEEMTENVLKSFLHDNDQSIRCNTKKIEPNELLKVFRESGVKAESGYYLPYAIRLHEYENIMSLPGFAEGWFQVQDESSMLVVQCADLKGNETVIDVCSAPGGKALHAADRLTGKGYVSARDLTEYKINKIKENVDRCSSDNITLKVWDATKLDEEWIEKADVVIADLPCSGLGVIGKKVDIKYHVSEQSLNDLQELQKSILNTAVKYVKPDGILMYSTCTIHKGENEDMVKWLEQNHQFACESIDEYLPIELQGETTKKGYLQMIPGIHKTDGFFLAKLRRKG